MSPASEAMIEVLLEGIPQIVGEIGLGHVSSLIGQGDRQEPA
jgi:hypothetical protein